MLKKKFYIDFIFENKKTWSWVFIKKYMFLNSSKSSYIIKYFKIYKFWTNIARSDLRI